MSRGLVLSFRPSFPSCQFWIFGPCTATGHSSVIFTSECQITMTLNVIKPILAKLQKVELQLPAPTVEVTKDAQDKFYKALRAEMKKKVWEKNGGVSWYVDQKTGLCTVSLTLRSR